MSFYILFIDYTFDLMILWYKYVVKATFYHKNQDLLTFFLFMNITIKVLNKYKKLFEYSL